MGTNADRLTGYFWTSASKRPANAGENRVMVSGLISATPVAILALGPAPTLRLLYPSPLPRLDLLRRAMFLLQSAPMFRSVHLRAAISPRLRHALNPATALRGVPEFVPRPAQQSLDDYRSIRVPRCN